MPNLCSNNLAVCIAKQLYTIVGVLYVTKGDLFLVPKLQCVTVTFQNTCSAVSWATCTPPRHYSRGSSCLQNILIAQKILVKDIDLYTYCFRQNFGHFCCCMLIIFVAKLYLIPWEISIFPWISCVLSKYSCCSAFESMGSHDISDV